MATAADDRDTTVPADRTVRRDLLQSENRDPITDAPGSHPVGTGIGAVTAGMAGAAAGSFIPGIGTLVGGAVGAAIGAVAGGLVGKSVAESINPTDEHAYWRDEYRSRDYYKPDLSYDADYGPAYSVAIDSYNTDPARPFENAQDQLRQSWEARRGPSRLDWDGAKSAMKDVYDRTRNRESLAKPDKE